MSQFLEAVGFGVLNDVLSIFRSNEGYAQPNKYDVVITRPTGGGQSFANIANMMKGQMGGLSSGNGARDIGLRCESVSLPGRNLATSTDANIYGPTREIVEGVTYAEDITLVFQSSNDLKERVFFESWQEMAFNHKSWNMQYYNDYIGSIDIYLLDREMNRRYGIKLWEAFPKTVAAIDLGYDQNNSIIKTSVSFSFRYWETLDIERQSPNLLGRLTETVLGTVERNLSKNIPSTVRKLF